MNPLVGNPNFHLYLMMIFNFLSREFCPFFDKIINDCKFNINNSTSPKIIKIFRISFG